MLIIDFFYFENYKLMLNIDFGIQNNDYLCENYYFMETKNKSIFKPVDEIVRLMKESKKQSKIENEKRYQSVEFQEILKKLRAMKNDKS